MHKTLDQIGFLKKNYYYVLRIFFWYVQTMACSLLEEQVTIQKPSLKKPGMGNAGGTLNGDSSLFWRQIKLDVQPGCVTY